MEASVSMTQSSGQDPQCSWLRPLTRSTKSTIPRLPHLGQGWGWPDASDPALLRRVSSIDKFCTGPRGAESTKLLRPSGSLELSPLLLVKLLAGEPALFG